MLAQSAGGIPLDFLHQHYPLVGCLGLSPSTASPQGSAGKVDSLAHAVDQLKERLVKAFNSRSQKLHLDLLSPLPKLRQMRQYDGPMINLVQFELDYAVPQSSGKPLSSSTSPGNPACPLFPDGLMHSSWIVKHCEQLPAIIVQFVTLVPVRLSDYNPLEPAAVDVELCQLINDTRKRVLGSRTGIKYVVVALTLLSLNDSSVEERGLYIKKACGLEARHSFFVLSTAQSDLSQFVLSLEDTLLEFSHSYYKEMGRKVKKKKGKATQITFKPPISSLNSINLAGWNLRYDYKMAFFAEMMQDFELSVKHYITAYNALMDFFNDIRNKEAIFSSGNPNFIRPYSQRWHEILDLFDSISFKISCFLAFSLTPIEGLYQLNRHINFIKSLRISQGEIIEKSVFFWSWAARQYSLFGDLINCLSQSSITIPLPGPASNIASEYLISELPISYAFGCSEVILRHGRNIEGLSVGVLHSGYYYLMSGKCIIARMNAAEDVATRNSTSTSEQLFLTRSREFIDSQTNIDHCTAAVDVFTKSYEQFKKLKHARMTFYLAYFIAEVYKRSEKYDMALRFFERISKTYRRERWNLISAQILQSSLECALKIQSPSVAITNLIELSSSKITPVQEKRKEWLAALRSVANSPLLSQDINVSTENISSFLHGFVMIQQSVSFVGAPVSMQIQLDTGPSPIAVDLYKISVRFSNPKLDFDILNDESYSQCTSTDMKRPVTYCKTTMPTESSMIVRTGKLSFAGNSLLVIETAILPLQPQEIRIKEVIVTAVSNHLNLDFRWNGSHRLFTHRWLHVEPSTLKPARWTRFESLRDPRVMRVNHKQPEFKMHVRHQSPALIGEEHKFHISVKNGEKESLRAYLSISVDRGDAAVADEMEKDVLCVPDRPPASADVEKMDIGTVMPSSSVDVDFSLHLKGKASIRVLHVSVFFRLASEKSSADLFGGPAGGFYSQLSETVQVDVQQALDIDGISHLAGDAIGKSLFEMNIKNTSTVPLRLLGLTFDDSLIESSFSEMAVEEAEISPNGMLCVLGMRKGSFKLNGACTFKCIRIDNQQEIRITQALSEGYTQLSPIHVTVEHPPQVYSGEATKIVYTIRNTTLKTSDILVVAEISEQFVYSGNKQITAKLLPHDQIIVMFNCWPLTVGEARVPSLRIFQKELADGQRVEIGTAKTSSIMILPKRTTVDLMD